MKSTSITLAAFLLVCYTEATAAEPTKPNIVLILADDLGYGDLGCYGATKVKTPNIDKLASEGRRFTDAHSASSVCTPSRYAILTGEYPCRKSLWGPVMNPSPLVVDVNRPTLASLLKDQGYHTVCFGKWHLGFGDKPKPDWNKDLKPGPLECGFDHYFGIPVVSSHPLFVWLEDYHVVGLDPADPLKYGGDEETQMFPEKMLKPAMSGRLNGDSLGFKFDSWEGGHRVPFIARWPGTIPAGSVSDQLICHIDFVATFAALTGSKVTGPDSVNVLPALIGTPDKPVREHLVITPSKEKNLALREGLWLYIGAQGGGGFAGEKPGDHLLGGPSALKFTSEINSDITDGKIKTNAPDAQLYDLEADRSQSRNIIGKSLILSDFLLEKYLSAASKSVAKAIRFGDLPTCTSRHPCHTILVWPSRSSMRSTMQPKFLFRLPSCRCT